MFKSVRNSRRKVPKPPRYLYKKCRSRGPARRSASWPSNTDRQFQVHVARGFREKMFSSMLDPIFILATPQTFFGSFSNRRLPADQAENA